MLQLAHFPLQLQECKMHGSKPMGWILLPKSEVSQNASLVSKDSAGVGIPQTQTQTRYNIIHNESGITLNWLQADFISMY
jgi:hypothetical protein